MVEQSNWPEIGALYMKRTNKSQKKKVVTFVGDGVLHLWAFVTLVGVVTFVGATTLNVL